MAQSRQLRRSMSTPLAILLATPVHLLTLAVAALGVALLWPGTSFYFKLLGVVCLLLAYTRRPSLGDAASAGSKVDLRRCPELAAIITEVVSTLDSAAPTRVEVTSKATADMRLTGLHGRHLSIGVALWLALSGPERLALIGHQLGHLARRDLLVRR